MRGAVQHINEVIEGGPRIFDKARNISSPVDAVIVCTGLGARSLGGVEDKAMYPLRGQTVLLRAPWVNFGRSNDWTYIIPRRSGDVCISRPSLEVLKSKCSSGDRRRDENPR